MLNLNDLSVCKSMRSTNYSIPNLLLNLNDLPVCTSIRPKLSIKDFFFQERTTINIYNAIKTNKDIVTQRKSMRVTAKNN